FINAIQLIVMMVLLLIGIMVSRATIVAPVYNDSPIGSPPMMPFIFIIIACGAISGFHSLVSSGTSSKQISKEKDALFIGYGGMLLEGVLSILVIIAVSAGIGMGIKGGDGSLLTGIDAWNSRYISWQAVSGLSAKIGAFVLGSSNLMSSIGIPTFLSVTIMGVFLVSFASTTLDSAVRLQRYVITELADTFGIKFIAKRYQATSLAVLSALLLIFMQPGGKGALILWPLFGSVNQLLAALALTVSTVYLKKINRPYYVTAIPMVFMLLMTGWAMLLNIEHFYIEEKWFLFVVGSLLFILELWMLIESFLILINRKNRDFGLAELKV
ncbi:MAG: carbon starvation protein A, partial [Nitrospirae bacterium]